MENEFSNILAGIYAQTLKKYEREGYAKDNEGDYICPKCNAKATFHDDNNNIVATKCDCDRAKEAEEERKRNVIATEERRKSCFASEVMKRHNFSADNGINPKITNIMKNYVENFPTLKKEGRGLLLYGKTGTGKTFFASCIVNALIDNGYKAKQTTIQRLMSELAVTVDKQSIIDNYARHDIVIIDDLGTERQTDFAKQFVFDVIDTFYNARTPMIITTNLNISAFKNPTADEYVRIYQRILERCSWVEIKNDSHRVNKIIDGYENSRKILGL